MVTGLIWCWLTIHSSNDALDNRQYIKVKGHVLQEGSETNKISFVEEFQRLHINTALNEPIRWVKDNECLYAP